MQVNLTCQNSQCAIIHNFTTMPGKTHKAFFSLTQTTILTSSAQLTLHSRSLVGGGRKFRMQCHKVHEQNFDRQQKYVYTQTTKGRRAHVKSNGANHNQIQKQRKELPKDKQGQEQQCVDSTH